MKKTYGKLPTAFIEQRPANRSIFSDSMNSSDASCDKYRDGPQRKENKHPEKRKSKAGQQKVNPKNKENLAKKTSKENKENIPNFEAFDDYELVIQPVTPLKTKISVSSGTPNSWKKFPSNELLAEIEKDMFDALQTSSPKSTSKQGSSDKIFSQNNSSGLELCSSCPGLINQDLPVNSSLPKKLTEQNSNYSGNINSFKSTRRSKRLHHILNDSVNTSTPDQMLRKVSRLASPGLVADISKIPTLEIDDGSDESDHHVSLHESLQKSSFNQKNNSDCGKSPYEATPSKNHLKADSIQHSPSIFSSDYSDSCSNELSVQSSNALPYLDSIIEEPNLEDGALTHDSLQSIKSVDEDIETIDHIMSVMNLDHNLSSMDESLEEESIRKQSTDEQIFSIARDFQCMASPTLAQLTQQRREKYVLRECFQTRFLDWHEYLPCEQMESMRKIGEGVYGEVYRHAYFGEVRIIKVVPMGGKCTVNDEPQKTLDETAKEVRITRMLSELRSNFIKVNQIRCVEGQYPNKLLDAWDWYAENKVSENDRPDYLPCDQKYIVFDFGYGGEALEAYEFMCTSEGVSVVLQIGWCLAVAEDFFRFEHRDLHWSNVLLAKADDKEIDYRFKSSDDKYTVSLNGVRVNIIDFTLSRLETEREVLFCDLSTDETLFQGYGDFQFDVYRQMKAVTGNSWKDFNSVTNILWVRYILDKLIKMKKFPSNKKSHLTSSQFKKQLKSLYERCSRYSSAVQMVLTDSFFQDNTACYQQTIHSD